MIANVSYWRKTRGALSPTERESSSAIELTRWKEEGHKLYILRRRPPSAPPGLLEAVPATSLTLIPPH